MCNLRVDSADAYPSMSSIGIRRRLKVLRAFLDKFSPTVSSATRGPGRPYSTFCSIREDEDEMKMKNCTKGGNFVVQVQVTNAGRRHRCCHKREVSTRQTLLSALIKMSVDPFISMHLTRREENYLTIYRCAVTS